MAKKNLRHTATTGGACINCQTSVKPCEMDTCVNCHVSRGRGLVHENWDHYCNNGETVADTGDPTLWRGFGAD